MKKITATITTVIEDHQIKLAHCSPNDIVRLKDGSVGLVVEDVSNVVRTEYKTRTGGGDLTLVSLKCGSPQIRNARISAPDIEHSIRGEGAFRISEIVGKLEIEVS